MAAGTCALAGTATRAVVGAVRRSAVLRLNTRYSVRSVLQLLAVVWEVARGRTGSRKSPTSINVRSDDSVALDWTELGVQPANSRVLVEVAVYGIRLDTLIHAQLCVCHSIRPL